MASTRRLYFDLVLELIYQVSTRILNSFVNIVINGLDTVVSKVECALAFWWPMDEPSRT